MTDTCVDEAARPDAAVVGRWGRVEGHSGDVYSTSLSSPKVVACRSPLAVPSRRRRRTCSRPSRHPGRVRILELLAEGERTIGELAAGTGMELSHLSQQVTVLRRAGVVDSRRVKNTVVCSLRDPQTAELLAVARRMLTRTLRDDQELLAALSQADDAVALADPVTDSRRERRRAVRPPRAPAGASDCCRDARTTRGCAARGRRDLAAGRHGRRGGPAARTRLRGRLGCRGGPGPRHRGDRRRGRGGVRRLVPPGLRADRRHDRGAGPPGRRSTAPVWSIRWRSWPASSWWPRPCCGWDDCWPSCRGRWWRASRSGIAVVIAAQQVPSAPRRRADRTSRTPWGARRSAVARFVAAPNWAVLGLLALSVLLTAGLPRLHRSLPAGLLAVAVVTLVVEVSGAARRPDRLVALLPAAAGAARSRQRGRPARGGGRGGLPRRLGEPAVGTGRRRHERRAAARSRPRAVRAGAGQHRVGAVRRPAGHGGDRADGGQRAGRCQHPGRGADATRWCWPRSSTPPRAWSAGSRWSRWPGCCW